MLQRKLNYVIGIFFLVLQIETININDISSLVDTNQIVSINTSNINVYEGPKLTISIPLELLKEFAVNGSIRIVSSAFRNITALFFDETEK